MLGAVVALLALPLSVSLGISPAAALGPNLVANPSVETPAAGSAARPEGWTNNKWGTNTVVFGYTSASAHTRSIPSMSTLR